MPNICKNSTIIPMLNIISVFIGGGLGSVLRYLTNITFGKTVLCMNCSIPLATLAVNILGSFVLGILYALFIQKTNFPIHLKLGLTVGFCGGLTTFSTFSFEAYNLLKNGEIIAASGYILLSMILCIIITGAGIYTGTLLGVHFAK